jgi:hypothetical protein
MYIIYTFHFTNVHVFNMAVTPYIKLNITDIRWYHETYVTFKPGFVKIGSTIYKLIGKHRQSA